MPFSNTPFSTPWARTRSRVAQRVRQYCQATNGEKWSDTTSVVPSSVIHTGVLFSSAVIPSTPPKTRTGMFAVVGEVRRMALHALRRRTR